MRAIQTLLVVGAAVLLAACNSSPRRLGPSRDAIEAAAGDLDRGELAAAIAQSDLALARLSAGSESDLQCFAASLLAVKARARSGVELSNLVSITMYADLARLAARAARSAERTGEALPESLAALDVDRSLEYLDLVEIGVHARLGFESSVARVLQRRGEPLTFAAVQAQIERAGVEADLVPALHLALFRYLRNTDEPTAFRFGALALDRAAARGAVLTPVEIAEIEHWIESGSSYEFRCPRCDLAVLPRLRACPNDQTPNVEFTAIRRQ